MTGTLRIITYSFHHDTFGNPTSHFQIWKDGKVLHGTKRRQQCGYDDKRIEHALYWLSKNGTDINQYELKNSFGSRHEDKIVYEYERRTDEA